MLKNTHSLGPQEPTKYDLNTRIRILDYPFNYPILPIIVSVITLKNRDSYPIMGKRNRPVCGKSVYTYDIPLTVTAFEAGLRRL